MHCYLPVTPLLAKVNAERALQPERNTGFCPRKEERAMSKTRDDLTISEALRDPLIAMVMRADGVKLDDFKRLLETAAVKREQRVSPVGKFINAVTGNPGATCSFC
jgi:hypothetical protein